MNMGLPMSCIGNNMAYRKEAYEKIGGYESISFSVTEDFRLLKELKKLKNKKVIYPLDKDTLVSSLPCDNIKTLYRQRKRWSVGGLESDWFGTFIMTLAALTNFSVILVPILLFPIGVIFVLVKSILDFLFIKKIFKLFKLKLSIKKILVFEMYYVTYSVLIPVILLFSKKVIWKDRAY